MSNVCGQGDESGAATDIERFESVVGNSGQNADLQSLFSVDVLLVSPCNTGQRKSAPAGTRTRALGLGNRCSIRLSYRGALTTKRWKGRVVTIAVRCRPPYRQSLRLRLSQAALKSYHSPLRHSRRYPSLCPMPPLAGGVGLQRCCTLGLAQTRGGG